MKDDGKPLPPGATPEQMLHSHNVCKECTPAYEEDVERQIQAYKAKRGVTKR
jgi:hypothetical protein